MTDAGVAVAARMSAFASIGVAALIAAIAIYGLTHPAGGRLSVIAAGRRFRNAHGIGGLVIACAIVVLTLPAAIHPEAADQFAALYGPLGHPLRSAAAVFGGVLVAFVLVMRRIETGAGRSGRA